MRPAGDIRRAALAAAWEAARPLPDGTPRGATYHDLTRRLVPQGISESAVRNTWKNLVRSGRLRKLGTVKVAGVCRPMLACVPAEAMPPMAAPSAAGADLARAWSGMQLSNR